MTAMNIVVQSRVASAFLLTDTARYREDGSIERFAPKVFAVECKGRYSAAIATTGMISRDYWLRAIPSINAQDAESFLRAIPTVFRSLEAAMVADRLPEACGSSHLSAVVAIFDHDTQHAEGYAISNDRSLFQTGPGEKPYHPFELCPVRKYLTRFAGRPFASNVDVCDPDQWDPESESASLIEAQRVDHFDFGGCSHAAVGGQAMLTRIDAQGVRQSIIKAWGDRRGATIDPFSREDLGYRVRTAVRQITPPRLTKIRVSTRDPRRTSVVPLQS